MHGPINIRFTGAEINSELFSFYWTFGRHALARWRWHSTSKCWEPITHCHIQQDSNLQGLL